MFCNRRNVVVQPLLKAFHGGIEKKPGASRLGFTGTAKGSVAHSCLQKSFLCDWEELY